MRRQLASLVILLLVIQLPALAQTVEDVAEEVEFRGYYVSGGLDIAVNDMENLVADYPGIGFVALSGDPADGADLFADEVLAAIDDPDTVIVLSETEAGLVSDGVFSDSEIDAALDDAFATSGDTYLTDFAQLAAALTGEAPSSSAPTDGGAGLPIGWIILVVVIGGVWLLWRRGRKQREDAAVFQLDTAKAEIQEQMSVVANQILEFSDRPDQDRSPEAVEHYRRASAVFKAAEDRMAAATTPAELESLSDDLDIARWEMAAAEAIVEGREVPAKPEAEKPTPCFFDPTHGAGVEEAQLQTATGGRTVMVCRADAERLRAGEKPEPRTIDVGGRRVPAPQAPRSSGGGGMDWLDAFSILVGGMTGGADYSWGQGGGRRRSGGGLGGVLGGMLGGAAVSQRRSGGSGLPSLPSRRGSSSSRTTSRSRSSSPRPSRSTARGRRSR